MANNEQVYYPTGPNGSLDWYMATHNGQYPQGTYLASTPTPIEYRNPEPVYPYPVQYVAEVQAPQYYEPQTESTMDRLYNSFATMNRIENPYGYATRVSRDAFVRPAVFVADIAKDGSEYMMNKGKAYAEEYMNNK